MKASVLPKLNLLTPEDVKEPSGTATKQMVFRVELTAPAAGDANFCFNTTPSGTAQPNTNYVPIQFGDACPTIHAGDTEADINVTILNDGVKKDPLTVGGILFFGDGDGTTYQPGNQAATGRIIDESSSGDTTLPKLTIEDAKVTEKDGSQSLNQMIFIVRLSKAAEAPVEIHFATVDTGSATPDVDFESVSDDVVTIPVGEKIGRIIVNVIGDTQPEGKENFQIALNQLTGATAPPDLRATGVIVDNDKGGKAPKAGTLSVSNAAPALEGGPTDANQATFSVKLAGKVPTGETVEVDFDTDDSGADGAAKGDVDFVPVHRQLTFNPGDTVIDVPVALIGDNTVDTVLRKVLVAGIGNADGATIKHASATGAIVEDDPTLKLSLTAQTQTAPEGALSQKKGKAKVTFEVSLDRKLRLDETVGVDFQTLQDVTGEATPGTDFTPVTQRLTFTDARQSQTVTVPIVGDNLNEPDEKVFAELVNPEAAVIDQGTAFATIQDDDGVVLSLSPSPAQVTKKKQMQIREGCAPEHLDECDAGGRQGPCTLQTCAVFIAELDQPAHEDVTVNLQVGGADGDTAADNTDFDGGTYAVTFPAGERFAVIAVRVVKDDLPEPTYPKEIKQDGRRERFTATLQDPSGAHATLDPKNRSVQAWILDDDAQLPDPDPGFENAGLYVEHNGALVQIGYNEVRPGVTSAQCPIGCLVFAPAPGSPIISEHGAGVLASSTGIISNDGASLISNDGASIISNDGGSIIGPLSDIISNDGASLVAQALVAQTAAGASIISNDGASIISNDGGSLIAGGNGALIDLPWPGNAGG